jgi:hypothetical protein
VSIVDAQKLNEAALAQVASVRQDPNLSDQAKHDQVTQIRTLLGENLDAQRAKDLAQDADFQSRYTAQARSVLPSQQTDYRERQSYVARITDLRSAQAEATRAQEAGDQVGLTALGLHAYDTGTGANNTFPGAGDAWLKLAQSTLSDDRVRALNKLASHQTAGPFGMLSYVVSALVR